MVTSPACGIPAAPMLAAVAVMLGGETEEQSANTLYNTNNGLVEEGTFLKIFLQLLIIESNIVLFTLNGYDYFSD